jgi:hypothetical protein
MVVRIEPAMAITFYRKLTHTGRYLNLKSHQPPNVKRGIFQSLHNRTSTTRQEEYLFNETDNLRRYLQLSGCPQQSIESVPNS